MKGCVLGSHPVINLQLAKYFITPSAKGPHSQERVLGLCPDQGEIVSIQARCITGEMTSNFQTTCTIIHFSFLHSVEFHERRIHMLLNI